jgi:MurNAc alpha-1-phosphate uridylyltransferase
MQLGNVSAELYQGYWADIGTPQRLADADILFRSKS